MSGGILNNRFQMLALAVFISVAQLISGNGVYAATAANSGKQTASLAPATNVASAKNVAGNPAATTKTPVSAALKTLTPPMVAGYSKVVSPDASKSLVPDASRLVSSAKTHSELVAELEKAKAKTSEKKTAEKKNKKIVKSRKLVVDAQIITWASRASDASAMTYSAARKLVGNRRDFLTKDSYFITDRTGRQGCFTKINFSDMVPENWYLETEMVVGFGNTYERALGEAMRLAFARVKIVRNGDWVGIENSAKNASDLGVIPYSTAFSISGNEYYCKLYFRYFKPKD